MLSILVVEQIDPVGHQRHHRNKSISPPRTGVFAGADDLRRRGCSRQRSSPFVSVELCLTLNSKVKIRKLWRQRT
jgi:hypothetical protein